RPRAPAQPFSPTPPRPPPPRQLPAGPSDPPLPRHELERVAGGGLRLSNRAIHVDTRYEREIQVRFAVGDLPRDAEETSARRLGQVALRPQTVQEESEDSAERGIQIGIWLTFPLETRLGELPATQGRQDHVAVDAFVGAEAIVGNRGQTLGPIANGGLATAERFRREVLRPLVVGGEAEHAGPGRRFLVA